MYLDIERMLFDVKLASILPEPCWMNKDGVRVDNKNDAYGCKVKTTFTLPQCCLVMDEVGGDINMMNDEFIGGKKFLTRKGDAAKMNATKKSPNVKVTNDFKPNLLGVGSCPCLCSSHCPSPFVQSSSTSASY